jgi:hypothetical protein
MLHRVKGPRRKPDRQVFQGPCLDCVSTDVRRQNGSAGTSENRGRTASLDGSSMAIFRFPRGTPSASTALKKAARVPEPLAASITGSIHGKRHGLRFDPELLHLGADAVVIGAWKTAAAPLEIGEGAVPPLGAQRIEPLFEGFVMHCRCGRQWTRLCGAGTKGIARW